MDTKYCKGCSSDVPVTKFTKHNATKDGLQSTCNDCRNRARREARREKKGYYATERERNYEQHKRACVIRYYECKKQVFDHYCGGEYHFCSRCGFDDERALSIDHINRDGAEHRRQLKGVNLCKWIVKNNFPSNFRVLCMNCQCIEKYTIDGNGIRHIDNPVYAELLKNKMSKKNGPDSNIDNHSE